ncbi:MAG: Gfo/Idh/MocA family oxidoreductase [Acidobacteria bacterium]|nr:Gfo/Idh/MocA family oxidoreductase [Acidobacteriota bacterium]
MKPSSETIPVVVIGAGEHGKRHARLLRRMGGAELTGVYDQRPERSQEVATELGVRSFSSLEEALDHGRAASIVIPTSGHAAVASRALERGLDVLVEKPIAGTVEQADHLIRQGASLGRILQVGHVERFNPGVLAARAVTRNPLFLEVHRLGVFSPRSLDVDVVFDLMIHDLDLALWLVRAPVTEVRAVGLAVLSDKVDIANARVEFENGAVANFTASRVSTEKIRKFRYFQPHEYISIDFSRRDALLLTVDRNSPTPRINFRKLDAPAKDPLEAELESFVECVRTRQPPLVGGLQGREALALAVRVMSCIQEHAARVHLSEAGVEGHRDDH